MHPWMCVECPSEKLLYYSQFSKKDNINLAFPGFPLKFVFFNESKLVNNRQKIVKFSEKTDFLISISSVLDLNIKFQSLQYSKYRMLSTFQLSTLRYSISQKMSWS